MTRRLIIHAGLAHTGSSAIQEFCAANRDGLLELNVLYPASGMNGGGNHIHLVREILGQPLNPAYCGGREDFRKLVKNHPLKTVVISSEYIGIVFQSQDATERFFSFFRDEGFSPEVVVFLRPMPGWTNSGYAQRAKSFSLKLSFQDFVAKQPQRIGGIWQSLLRVRSQAKTQFIPYGSGGKTGGAERFLQVIGLSEHEVARLHPERRINASIGPVAVAAVWDTQCKLQQREWQLAELHRRALRNYLAKMLEARAPEPSFQGLDDALCERLETSVAAYNDDFAEKVWGARWAEVFPPQERAPCNLIDVHEADAGISEQVRLFSEALQKRATLILANPRKAVPRPWLAT